MDALVSVIVPVYQVEKYLPACIDSILCQTYRNLELLLVDDGSTDNSGIICDEYAGKDSRVKVIHKPNEGVSSARNTGLAAAGGDFVSFIDSDDFIDPDLYQAVMRLSDKSDIVFFHYTIERNGRSEQIVQSALNDLRADPLNFELFYQHPFEEEQKKLSAFSTRAVYRRQFLCESHAQFPTQLRSGEDRIFLYGLLLHRPRIEVANDESGYHYLIRGSESLTGNKNLDHYVPWLYEQNKNFDEAEQRVCRMNPTLSAGQCKSIRLLRAYRMRQQVIINEFKNNKAHAVENITSYRKTDLFRFAYRFSSFLFEAKHGGMKGVIRFILVKLRLYFVLKKIY